MMRTTADLTNSDLFAVLLILLTLIMVVYYVKAIIYYRKVSNKKFETNQFIAIHTGLHELLEFMENHDSENSSVTMVTESNTKLKITVEILEVEE